MFPSNKSPLWKHHRRLWWTITIGGYDTSSIEVLSKSPFVIFQYVCHDLTNRPNFSKMSLRNKSPMWTRHWQMVKVLYESIQQENRVQSEILNFSRLNCLAKKLFPFPRASMSSWRKVNCRPFFTLSKWANVAYARNLIICPKYIGFSAIPLWLSVLVWKLIIYWSL